MGENRSSFIITLLVMFIFFLSWISIVFSIKTTLFFKTELVLLIIFLLAAIYAMTAFLTGKNKWRFLIKFYGASWINLLVIYFVRFGIKEVILPFVVTGIGFVVALIKLDSDDLDESESELDEPEPVKKEFKPGKYIASKTGVKYHIPKCDWAKKIKKENRVWFDSKEEAEAKGLKACNCVG